MAADAATTTPTLEELRAENTRLKAANKTALADLDAANLDLRAANGEARDRRHDLKARDTQIVELTADRDRYKGLSAVDTDGWKAKHEASSGELRGIKHRKEFDALAGVAGVKDPSRVDALFTLSGYKPEKDEIDKPAITTLIATALTGRDWLKSEAAAGAAATTAATAAAAATTAAGAAKGSAGAPGSDRGQSVSSTASASPGRITGRL